MSLSHKLNFVLKCSANKIIGDNMKKRSTLTAGIMNIVSGIPIMLIACYIFVSGLSAVEPLVLIPGLGIFGVFYFIVSIFIACVGCVVIAFGVCEIGYACKGDLYYSGKKVSLIVHIVFLSIIMIAYLFVGLTMSGNEVPYICIFFAIVEFVAICLIVFDMVKFDRKDKAERVEINNQK